MLEANKKVVLQEAFCRKTWISHVNQILRNIEEMK